MRRAFTLVELLVSFTVLAVISGGALIYLNNFIAKEELNTVSSEVVTSLKLAQSYAKTRQLPLLASGKNDLKFVQVQVIGGKLVAGANGVGDTYFTIVPKNEKIILATNPVIIYFWAGDGKLVKDATGTPYTSSENAYIIIQSDNNLVGYDQVEISNLGQIISSFANGTANLLKITPLPTMAILPTILVTKVPTALPTVSSCLPENFYRCFSDTDCCSGLHCGYNGNCNSYCLVNGSACTSNGEICCSENCQNGICQPHPILTPIPTKLPCKAFGATCSVYDIGLLYQGGTACCNRGCSNSKCCRGNGQNCDTDADCCLFDSKTNSYKNFGCVNKVCLTGTP